MDLEEVSWAQRSQVSQGPSRGSEGSERSKEGPNLPQKVEGFLRA